MPEELSARHNIMLENRKSMLITGVKEVVGFNDEEAELVTAMGNLSIRGSNLKMGGFSNEKGELSLSGLVIAAVYTTDSKKTGFFSKLFR